MEYYVYILQSEKDCSFYKGFTSDPRRRLDDHNEGKSQYTSIKKPWTLVYVEQLPDKATAIKREKSLKRSNQDYLRWLISTV